MGAGVWLQARDLLTRQGVRTYIPPLLVWRA